MAVLEIKSLTKWYGIFRGVEDVSFNVEPGEIFGYLGPNGSGKTTTIRCALGLLRPGSGEIRLFGRPVRSGQATEHDRIGYLPGDFRIWRGLTAERSLRMFAALGGRASCEARQKLAERFSLDLDRPVAELSKGNRQKVGVLYAFQNKPDLLILDEPTSGLDPLMRQIVLDLIREAAAGGAAILLSSHDLSEVSAVCSRAGILREGRLVELDQISNIIQKGERHLEVWFVDKSLQPRFSESELPGVRVVEQAPGRMRLAWYGSLDPVLKWIAHFGVESMATPETSLEESFLQYYRGNGDLSKSRERRPH